MRAAAAHACACKQANSCVGLRSMRAQELHCVGGACMRACKIRFWPEIEQPWRARHGRAEEYASAGAALRRRRPRAHANSCAGLRSMRAQELQCVVEACMREYMRARLGARRMEQASS